MNKLKFELGRFINADNGFAQAGEVCLAATFRFYRVYAGGILHWSNPGYAFQLFFYSLETEERLIYSYCYQDEENWATYDKESSILDWNNGDIKIYKDGYIRLNIAKNGEINSDEEIIQQLSDIAWIENPEGSEKYIMPEYFTKEIDKVSDRINYICNHKSKKDILSFMVLTDTHYVVNGTWEDTRNNMAAVADKTSIDGIIHLGDITDGITPIEITKEYSGMVMDDMKAIGKRVYLCLGNHDSNYFKKNPEIMTQSECASWYLNRQMPWYYEDFDDKKLRMYFLFSFDQKEEIRYGFPKEEVEWVRDSLGELAKGWKVIVFSHVPPLQEIHFWSDAIRNGEELVSVLEKWHEENGNGILGYVHGHNHAEQVYNARKFSIISLGCNKLEDFKDKKPEGSFTCDRKRYTVSQDLWDTLIIDLKENTMDFVRFGAGEDKHISI